MQPAQRKGNVFIVSAASGTGKTTLVSRLLATDPNIKVSISHTTRLPRQGEIHGQHYHFVDTPEFERLIEEGAFLEHAKVFDNYYGTSFESINNISSQGLDVILEIDIQGAEQVRRALPDARSIFILPPSFTVLANRLKNRGTDSAEVIEKRLQKARHEIEQAYFFDYVVINDNLDTATNDLIHIIHAHRLMQATQHTFIDQFLKAV